MFTKEKKIRTYVLNINQFLFRKKKKERKKEKEKNATYVRLAKPKGPRHDFQAQHVGVAKSSNRRRFDSQLVKKI